LTNGKLTLSLVFGATKPTLFKGTFIIGNVQQSTHSVKPQPVNNEEIKSKQACKSTSSRTISTRLLMIANAIECKLTG